MYMAIVVTHAGPCKVTKELFDKIDIRKKKESSFGVQILFLIELDIEGYDFEVLDGEIDMVKQMYEFEKRFILTGSAAVRAITL